MDPRQLRPCRFDRRQIFFALFAVGLVPSGELSSARAQDAGMVEFVRDLYSHEIELHNTRVSVSAEAFFALFTRDLRTLMQAPHPYAGREPVGRILHAFFGWGVLPGQPVKLVQVVPADGGTRGLKPLQVDLMVRDEKRQIVVQPAREDGLWKIADISYDNGETLRTYYQRITGR